MAVVRHVECILQSFMLPPRELPHFCFGHRLASVLACAPFFAVSTSQLLAGPPMFGPLSKNKVVQTKGQTSRAVAKAG